MKLAGGIAVLLLLGSCQHDSLDPPGELNQPFPLRLPVGFPMPDVPPENPLTDASVRLGKSLFFEERLSRTGTLSCAGCHFPQRAFSDTVPLSLGVNGMTGLRNAPTLANVGYHPALFRDGGVPNLERQAIAPVHDHLEMDHDLTLVAADLRDVEPYASLSMAAYGRVLDPYVITRSIANYERTLISGWSRYDRYLNGDASALNGSEVRGLQLFNSEALNCTACHNGFDLSDHDYHNVGQYLAYADSGRTRITLLPGDRGKFKTPTLRNIALTAPYMHNGSMATIEEVIEFFASGGLPHPNRDPEMQSFVLSAQEKEDLIAFLNALTDERSIDRVP
ncbi:MAG: c-type cytochrome [Flavobacteriales bacterium]|nr:c-type cytochrome [Flavobacteriales bacterium]